MPINGGVPKRPNVATTRDGSDPRADLIRRAAREDRTVDTLSLNNREIAALIWIGIALVVVLRNGFGPSLLGILRDVLNPRIAVPLLALVAYVAAVLLALFTLDLWGFALLPDAVVWSLAVALPLFDAAAVRNPGTMRRRLAAALSLTVVVEVFVNLEVASLPVELVALPVITILFLIPIAAGRNPEYAAAVRLAEWLLAVLGIAAITFVIIGLASDWEGFDKLEAVREFLLPIILTLSLLPFLCSIWAYSALDTARARRRVRRQLGSNPAA